MLPEIAVAKIPKEAPLDKVCLLGCGVTSQPNSASRSSRPTRARVAPALRAAWAAAGHPLVLRMQPGYDHSYYFIASFIEEHLRHHAAALHA